MKILKRYNRTLISNVAYKCLDNFFTDFEERNYANAIEEAQRDLAKKYKLLSRIGKIQVEPGEVNTEIVLPFMNFDSEKKVSVNNVTYFRQPNIEKEDSYYLEYKENVWKFDYYNKLAGDIIEIEYAITEEESIEHSGNIILPDIYEDEIIRLAILKIAKLGIVKFSDERSNKYTKVYRLHQKEIMPLDPELNRQKSFSEIKIFNGVD